MALIPQPIESIKLSYQIPSRLTIGSIFQIRAFTVPKASSVAFFSSDSSVLRLLPDESNPCKEFASCLVEVVGYGEAIIRAVPSVRTPLGEQEVSSSTTITATKEPENMESPKREIILNTDYLKIALGEVFQLQAITVPPHGAVSWRSSNPRIADVQDGGIITGASKGISEITASFRGAIAKCLVEVVDLDILGDYFKIGVTERFKVPIGTYPSTYKILWSSSNEYVAPISEFGVVEGLSKGIVEICAVANTETGPISKVVTIEVAEYFEPWEYFDKSRLSKLEIYDTEQELLKAHAGCELKVVRGNFNMPTLYYIRVDKHPFLFNYKVAAVDKDIQKFLLL